MTPTEICSQRQARVLPNFSSWGRSDTSRTRPSGYMFALVACKRILAACSQGIPYRQVRRGMSLRLAIRTGVQTHPARHRLGQSFPERPFCCRKAQRCHAHPSPKPPECRGFPPIWWPPEIVRKRVSTIQTKCCLYLDGDGVRHFVEVLWDACICYPESTYCELGTGLVLQCPKGMRVGQTRRKCRP